MAFDCEFKCKLPSKGLIYATGEYARCMLLATPRKLTCMKIIINTINAM